MSTGPALTVRVISLLADVRTQGQSFPIIRKTRCRNSAIKGESNIRSSQCGRQRCMDNGNRSIQIKKRIAKEEIDWFTDAHEKEKLWHEKKEKLKEQQRKDDEKAMHEESLMKSAIHGSRMAAMRWELDKLDEGDNNAIRRAMEARDRTDQSTQVPEKSQPRGLLINLNKKQKELA
uniref:Cir_N domain-containing protein n=2 Tax=Caenorhabditis tropicalis TaxID=1561998 RepID=A0A1I7U6Y9_9PELO